jgi:hypothetical protein
MIELISSLFFVIGIDHTLISTMISIIIEHPFRVEQIMMTWFTRNESSVWYHLTLALHARSPGLKRVQAVCYMSSLFCYSVSQLRKSFFIKDFIVIHGLFVFRE